MQGMFCNFKSLSWLAIEIVGISSYLNITILCVKMCVTMAQQINFFYMGHPWDPKIVVDCYSDVLILYSRKSGPINRGLCKQVVAIHRLPIAQVCLNLIIIFLLHKI
jgi:hypothetical protein